MWQSVVTSVNGLPKMSGNTFDLTGHIVSLLRNRCMGTSMLQNSNADNIEHVLFPQS